MINKDEIVPDNTIALFTDRISSDFSFNEINSIIEEPSKKRDWFTPHFYKCLPLTIGNQQGFLLKSQYAIDLEWNGGELPSDIRITAYLKNDRILYPRITSDFGHGIVTIVPPFTLRTPPGVNLMTISPPNYILPNLTVMTGVVESDNLERNFTFNIKIQMPNIKVHIPEGMPLAAFIPIQRNFSDNFEIKNAEDIFSKKEIDEAYEAEIKYAEIRNMNNSTNRKDDGSYIADGLYMRGKKTNGDDFFNHQKP